MAGNSIFSSFCSGQSLSEAPESDTDEDDNIIVRR
jgi:hypothetical protein